MQTIEFWYEFASTYSYPAAIRVEDVSKQYDLSVVWRPFLLGPIFADQGLTDSPFNLFPIKGDYMWRDLQRTCKKLSIPFNKPSVFPQNGLLAARIAQALSDDNGHRAQFSRAVYTAEFGHNVIISDVEPLTRILDDLGWDAAGILDKARMPENKSQLRDATELAKTYGIFGVPTMRTADGELFWGNDRIEDAMDWAVTEAASA